MNPPYSLALPVIDFDVTVFLTHEFYSELLELWSNFAVIMPSEFLLISRLMTAATLGLGIFKVCISFGTAALFEVLGALPDAWECAAGGQNISLGSVASAVDYHQLVAAATTDDEGALTELLDIGATPAGIDAAFAAAAAAGSGSCLELLLAKGASVDAENEKGDTALDIVVRVGSLPCLQVLLKAKCDVSLGSRLFPALDLARDLGRAACATLLESALDEVSVTGGEGEGGRGGAARPPFSH